MTTAEDVRGRVRLSMGRAKERKERSGIVGRAVSSNDNKDKKNIKLTGYVNEHMQAARTNTEAFW